MDPRVLEAAAVGVRDRRLGEVVAAIVCVKPAFRGRVSEGEIMAVARQKFVFDDFLESLPSDIVCRPVFPGSRIQSWS